MCTKVVTKGEGIQLIFRTFLVLTIQICKPWCCKAEMYCMLAVQDKKCICTELWSFGKDTSHLYAKVDIHVQAGLPSQFLHTTSKSWMVWSSWNKARKFYRTNSHGSDPIANNGTAPVIRGVPAKCISNYCDSRSVWYTNWWEESWGKGGGRGKGRMGKDERESERVEVERRRQWRRVKYANANQKLDYRFGNQHFQ